MNSSCFRSPRERAPPVHCHSQLHKVGQTVARTKRTVEKPIIAAGISLARVGESIVEQACLIQEVESCAQVPF